jgi:hypothetical protein
LYEIQLKEPEMMMNTEDDSEATYGQLHEERAVLKHIYSDELVNKKTGLSKIEGDVHSCMSMNIHNHLIILDENNIYKLKIEKDEIHKCKSIGN